MNSKAMYPLDEPLAYPTAQWFIAGYSNEFTNRIVGRTILGNPLIFFRTSAGQPVALWGLCPHRLLPLELGHLEDDSVVCGYHGYTFDTEGACTRLATGGEPNPHCRIQRYPLVERGPLVWIWMGDPDQVDESLLPDASDIGLGEDGGGWRVDIATTMPMKARAALLVDNLFDLSHIAFIHSESIPGASARALVEPVVDETGDRIRVARTSPRTPVTPGTLLGTLFPDIDGDIHTVLHTELYNPSLINAGGPWASEILPDGRAGNPIGKLNFVHGITPETDRSTHYFGMVTRNFRIDDDQMSAMLAGQIDRVRAEDIDALEAVERQVDRYGNTRREFSTQADAGALRVRRILRRMIRSEQAAASKQA